MIFYQSLLVFLLHHKQDLFLFCHKYNKFLRCHLFFDKIFADDTGHVKDFKNFAKIRYFAEVSAMVNGKAAGRENDRERILAYNIGISIHDINFAARIYQMMKDRPEVFAELKDADMHDPAGKFWF